MWSMVVHNTFWGIANWHEKIDPGFGTNNKCLEFLLS